MFLGSGVDANNNLIYIDQVRRGKTNLKCPYCGGFLTAKKGQKKEHHFAHTEKSCQAVSQSNNLYLPFFDSFE
ncbi:MAG: competence protein CoiA family protein [Xenococcus sp. (in: cyanobacteria)]